jgi:hypothetical protein
MVVDNGLAEQCSSGECQSENRDMAKEQDASPTTPTAETNAATTYPSIERRRRRHLVQTGATSSATPRGRESNIDYFKNYYMDNTGKTGWINNSTTMSLLCLLFLIVLVQKGEFFPAGVSNNIKPIRDR